MSRPLADYGRYVVTRARTVEQHGARPYRVVDKWSGMRYGVVKAWSSLDSAKQHARKLQTDWDRRSQQEQDQYPESATAPAPDTYEVTFKYRITPSEYPPGIPNTPEGVELLVQYALAGQAVLPKPHSISKPRLV